MILAYSFGIDYKPSSFSAGTLLSSSTDFSESIESNDPIRINKWDLGEITFPDHNNILGRTDHTRNVVFIFFR